MYGGRCQLVLALLSIGCVPTTENPPPPDPPPAAHEPSELQRALAFELEHPDGPLGDWHSQPGAGVSADAEQVHAGGWAARIERSKDSPDQFTGLTYTLPLASDHDRITGERVTLRGWLRTEGVEGQAALWLREDGSTGPLAFDNMLDRAVTGTSEWTQFSIELPLEDRALKLMFGALLAGTGTIWVDDFELLVDDVPIEQAARVSRVPTIFETDTEFVAGSKLELRQASATQIESLVVLAKVWGFLKYHHPRVAAGELHWDFELFRVLPSVLAASDAEQRNAAIAAWIEGFGDIPACRNCASAAKNPQLSPRIEWIHDQALLGPKLASLLEQAYQNRPRNEQFWISLVPGVGNPDFSAEFSYTNLEHVDVGYRLLAAFRLWTIIETWFPYRDLIDERWDGVLRELLPTFIAAEQRDDYRLALLLLIARVHDTHANIWSAIETLPPVGKCGLPVDVRFLAGKAVVAAVHDGATTELQRGDVLLELGGESIAKLVETWTPYYAASNEPTRLRDIARLLSRGPCGPVQAKVDRNRRKLELTLERVESWGGGELRWHDRPGETFQMLGSDVAYLKLSSIQTEDIPKHVEAALGKRGLIIDIRNYPSAFTVFDLGQHLVAKPSADFVRFTKPELSNPGAFTWTKVTSIDAKRPHYAGKIVILVDEVTQSSAEYTTMAFRTAPGAIVIGSTTAGADGNVSPIPLPGGERTMISGIGVFYPDERPTQRIGIVPDIELRPTREGIAAGRDELLERALQEILGSDISQAQVRELAGR